jgi:two-component system phosphate regulon sensor histidine kinase PhoR
MKSDFVSFVTHQLRTPLAGIKWMLELAAEAPAGDDDVGSYIQDAREAADRLIALVNELLDISRLESGKLAIESTPTDVAALTAEVMKELALLVEEKGHRLAVHGTDGAALVMADPRLLREVVMNLTSNAIKYTAPGGDVTVEISHAKGELEWTIQDSGIGISKESQRRLFEKFYRADNALTMEADGTGLGLYLVRLIVERFGGRVWCESEVGRGSTFAFALPVLS